MQQLFLYHKIALYIRSISICHSLLHKVILITWSRISLVVDIFLSGRSVRFISPFGRFYEELRRNLRNLRRNFLFLSIFSLSLSLSMPLLSFSLSFYPFSFHLSHSLFSLSFSLAYLMDVFVLVLQKLSDVVLPELKFLGLYDPL